MKNVLAIFSSITGDNSVSNQLAKDWLRIRAEDGINLVERDLSSSAVPHLDGQTLGAFFTPEAQRSEEQHQFASLSDQLIAEIQNADTILITAPMYNLGIPSTLKAWFDHITRAGITFKYTDKGPQGLLTGKKAIVVTSRGGVYKETGYDFQVPYLKQILGFIGITNVEIVYAEGVAMGGEAKATALTSANEALSQLSA